MTARRTPHDLPRLAALVLVVLTAIPAHATGPFEVVRVDEHTDRIVLGGSMLHLADPDGDLDWSDVISPERAGDWMEIEGDTPNLGFDKDVHWFGVTLTSEAVDMRETLIEVQYPLLDNLSFHVLHDGRLERILETGDHRPFVQRAFAHTTFALPLNLGPGESRDLLLRVATSSAVQVPVVLWEESAFLGRIDHLYTINGVFYGVMISVMLYGLALFYTMRERNYLAFFAYIATFTLLMLALDGMGYQFIWSRYPFVQEHMFAFCLAAVTSVSLLFTDTFLHLERTLPNWRRPIRGLGLMSAVAALVAWAVPYASVIRPIVVLPMLSTLLVLALSFRLWRRGSRPAFLFLRSWLALMAGTCLMALAKFGIIPPSLLTENGPTLGVLAQAALMITAMAEDLKASRVAKHQATEKILKMQEESSRKLREEVTRQTVQLQDMMRKLAKVNEELDQHNKLDGLTGIFNRRAFDERLDLEFHRGRRTGTELSMLMIDIDHFKNFNDTYGHQVGDDCLRSVAWAIEVESRRTTDFAARYGGEEFAVILAETPGVMARSVGERMRAALEAMEFEVEGERVPVTVSVGVGSLRPVELDDDDVELVTALADKALYEAKENGRNRVALCLQTTVGEPV